MLGCRPVLVCRASAIFYLARCWSTVQTEPAHSSRIRHVLLQAADFLDDKSTFQSLCEVLCRLLQGPPSEVVKHAHSLRSSASSFGGKSSRKRPRSDDGRQQRSDVERCNTWQVRYSTSQLCALAMHTHTHTHTHTDTLRFRCLLESTL